MLQALRIVMKIRDLKLNDLNVPMEVDCDNGYKLFKSYVSLNWPKNSRGKLFRRQKFTSIWSSEQRNYD